MFLISKNNEVTLYCKLNNYIRSKLDFYYKRLLSVIRFHYYIVIIFPRQHNLKNNFQNCLFKFIKMPQSKNLCNVDF